jgi:hypothetical protein
MGRDHKVRIALTTATTAQTGTLASRQSLVFYLALAYAVSWPLWLLSRLAGGTLGTVLLVIGGFGPMLAAAVTLQLDGGSQRDWAREVLIWRVSPMNRQPIKYRITVKDPTGVRS